MGMGKEEDNISQAWGLLSFSFISSSIQKSTPPQPFCASLFLIYLQIEILWQSLSATQEHKAGRGHRPGALLDVLWWDTHSIVYKLFINSDKQSAVFMLIIDPSVGPKPEQSQQAMNKSTSEWMI